MEDRELLIGDLAAQTGVTSSALRFYEAAGLVRAERRTESGYRVYGSDATRRLLFIQRAKALGFTLAEIKRVVDAPRSAREDELAYFNRVLATKIKATSARIAGLRAMERDLRGLASKLTAQPPAAACHVGDCACWLPV